MRTGREVVKRHRPARMVRRQWQIGVVVTLLVAAAWMLGMLDRAELPTQDWRARWFGSFSPPPSDDVVIVGIDDQALRTIQSWPWDRIHLADAMKEIRLAGARVTALDVLLEEPQGPRPDSWTKTGELVDGDLALREEVCGTTSIAEDGAAARTRYVLACRFREPERAFDPSVIKKMPDPELIEKMVRAEIARLVADGELDEVMAAASFLVVWAVERVAFEWSLFVDGGESSSARRAILNTAAAMRCIPVSALLQTRFGVVNPTAAFPVPPVMAYKAALTLGQVNGDSFDGDGLLRRVPLWIESVRALWPALAPQAVARFLVAGDGCGLKVHGRADQLLSRTSHQLTGRRTAVGEPATNQMLHQLPMTSGRVAGQAADSLYFITWPKASARWQGQFQPDSGGAQHEISIGYVLEPKILARTIRHNWIELGKLIETAKGYGFADESLFAGPPARELDWLDSPTVSEWLREQETKARKASEAAKDFLELSAHTDPATLRPDDATMLANCKDIASGIPKLLDEIRAGVKRRRDVRANLKQILNDKLVFVGWTATGAAADTVHTSINPRTPGVYVHAAVANSMLTGFSRRFFPFWIDVLCICVLGVLGTLTAIRAAVWASPAIAIGLIVVWFLIAGVGLWDAAWRIASVTGPSLAVGGSWLAVTMHRLLVEQRARQRTEEQFRSYVSPEVVDMLVENPGLGSVAPQRRELTVMMADLEGFTALAERLGEEETAAVLSTYLGEMTRVLLRHGATIDKYLGDGIMAFWGAPLVNTNHAGDACRAALEMLTTLDRLNAGQMFGTTGALRLRIGLATGPLMVGDFGCPPYRSSYTVLGDTANLCERLEGANKLLGTSLLVSSRVRELAGAGWGEIGTTAAGSGQDRQRGHRRTQPGTNREESREEAGGTPAPRGESREDRNGADEFAWRFIGRAKLRGRVSAEEVFELVGGASEGKTDPEQNMKNASRGADDSESVNPLGKGLRMDTRLTLTGQGVREYSAGELESARLTFGRVTTTFGDDPLCRRYLVNIAGWQARIDGPMTHESLSHAGFDGTIDLTDA